MLMKFSFVSPERPGRHAARPSSETKQHLRMGTLSPLRLQHLNTTNMQMVGSCFLKLLVL